MVMSGRPWLDALSRIHSHQLLCGLCQLNGRSPYRQDIIYDYRLVAVSPGKPCLRPEDPQTLPLASEEMGEVGTFSNVNPRQPKTHAERCQGGPVSEPKDLTPCPPSPSQPAWMRAM